MCSFFNPRQSNRLCVLLEGYYGMYRDVARTAFFVIIFPRCRVLPVTRVIAKPRIVYYIYVYVTTAQEDNLRVTS